MPCLLGISAETLVLVAPRDGRVVFNCACRDVLAWTFSEQQLDLYHGRGEAITLRFDGAPGQAVGEVVTRLQVSPGGRRHPRSLGVPEAEPALQPPPPQQCAAFRVGWGPRSQPWHRASGK